LVCKYFKRNNRTLEITLPEANASAASTPLLENSSYQLSVTGEWEVLVQKRTGTTSGTLILEQHGEALTGMIKSEGGALPVKGIIKGRAISFTGQRSGFTAEFNASINGNAMTGQVYALSINYNWTAARLREIAPGSSRTNGATKPHRERAVI
jgi:hypothetical protein